MDAVEIRKAVQLDFWGNREVGTERKLTREKFLGIIHGTHQGLIRVIRSLGFVLRLKMRSKRLLQRVRMAGLD